jgi:hypothetical protein
MLGLIVCDDNNSFILKTKNNKVFLQHWYDILNNYCSKIIIVINEKYKNIVYDILGENINIISNINMIKNEDYNVCIYVKVNIIIDDITIDIIHKINNYYNINGYILEYNDIIGIVLFKKNIEELLINNEYLLINNQHLFVKDKSNLLIWDCSDLNNYKNYLNFLTKPIRHYIKGILIIVSLYIGNISQEKIDISIKCLLNLRKHYQEETIVIVDNNSLNTDWIKTANELNMYIIKNTSELFRYEIGAYNLALKYFKADKYICVHHNVEFHSKINEELEIDKPDVCVLLSGMEYADRNWELNVKTINKCLDILNMELFVSCPLVCWNCFYCNNLMMEELLKSGLLDLVANSKQISGAYERIFGIFFYRTSGNMPKIINPRTYDKKWFNQQ